MRFAGRTDANHEAIVAALRAAGALVCSLAGVGQGCPDLMACRGRKVLLLEVKDGTKSPSRRRLTQAQQDWQALGWPVVIVTSPAEAVLALQE